ncbi:MAG: GAF domain-containing protein, partial [Candidatus Binatia bacterium]
MERHYQPTRRVEALQEQVAYAEQLKQVTNRIHAAKDLDQLFVELQDEILSLFDAERLGLYAVDYDKKEVYSKFLDLNQVKEIRVPLNEQSVVGFVARHRKMVNLADAYDAAERARISPALSFDSSWDKKSGLRTTQVLTMPVCANNNLLTGVIQLINKKSGPRFTPDDEAKVRDLARTLGIALSNQYQLATKKATKFDALLAAQILSHAEMEAAIREAREQQQAVESILMEKYQISKPDIGASFSAFYQCPFFAPGERHSVPPALLDNINLNYLKANYWIPIGGSGESVEILIDDPHAFHKIHDIKRLFPLKEIKFWVGLREDILQFVNAVGAALDSNAPKDAVVTILGQLEAQQEEKREEPPIVVREEHDSAMVRLVNQIIIDAYKMGASDIHIEPYG